MLVNVLRILLNCNQVYSDLSINDIKKTVNQVFVNDPKEPDKDLELLKETIANPSFGFFADKSGLIFNIRFFSPYIKLKNQNKERNYIADKSDDPITSLIIKLFPSPAGQLTTSTTAPYNPLNLIDGNKKESVEFFANIFIAILKDEKSLKFNFSQGINETKKNFESREYLFKKLKSLFFRHNENSIFKEKTIKLLLIHSYMINILDPYVQGELEDYLSIYLSVIINNYKSTENSKFLDIKIEKYILQSAFNYYIFMDSFPYSPFNKPESNKYIPSYIRRTNQFSKNEDDKFSDCADVALLHLCNCLFFDKGKYSTKHLPNASPFLVEFYEKNKEVYTLTMEKRNDWSKVIQDLNEGKKDNGLKYPTDNVSYKKSTNNEVKSGIINMMNVLIRISGLENEKILNDINNDNLEKRLEFLIEKLSIKENEKSVAKVNLFSNTIQEYFTGIEGKYDFSGSFNIDFKYSNKTGGSINYFHFNNPGHVELKFVKNIISTYDIENRKEILDDLKNPSYHNLLFKTFLFPQEKQQEMNVFNYLNKIYLGGRIDNNDLSLKILQRNSEFIDELEEIRNAENKKNSEILEKIMSLILDKVELSDRATKIMFERFLYFKKYAINDLNYAITGYVKSLKENSKFSLRKWEEFFSSEIPEYESLNIGFCANHFARNGSMKKKIKDLLFEKIGSFVNLKELFLNNLNLNENELANIIRKLTNPEKIVKLDLSMNKGINLPKEIQNLKGLKSIVISVCEITKIPDYIFSLQNLEELILTKNKLKNYSPENFQNYQNLKIIDLSFNLISTDFLEKLFQFINPEELYVKNNPIHFLPNNIENLTNLKILNIEYSQITDLPVQLTDLPCLKRIYID